MLHVADLDFHVADLDFHVADLASEFESDLRTLWTGAGSYGKCWKNSAGFV